MTGILRIVAHDANADTMFAQTTLNKAYTFTACEIIMDNVMPGQKNLRIKTMEGNCKDYDGIEQYPVMTYNWIKECELVQPNENSYDANGRFYSRRGDVRGIIYSTAPNVVSVYVPRAKVLKKLSYLART